MNFKLRRISQTGLGFRLMSLMGAALLPLAILSYVQTLTSENVAESRARDAILGETLLAAAPQVDLLMQARGAAATLAVTFPQLIDDPDACNSLVSGVASGSAGQYSFVGFIPPDGNITCTSTGKSYVIEDRAWLAEMFANPEPRLTVNREGPISNTSIVNLSLPVFGLNGEMIGIASLSMPHSAIEAQGPKMNRGVELPLSLITFDDKGEILTSSTGMDHVGKTLPSKHPLGGFVGQAGQSFLDVAANGDRRAFAVVPLSPGKLYLMGSWPDERLDGGGFTSGFPAITFPLLMWAASLLVAWLATESQVLRHVRALRDSITSFAGGSRKITPLQNDTAALELREAGDAFEQMTEAILHDEAQLENIIHQKEVLLREVHHRVKNNLQLIASILNMQLRTARSAEAQGAMRHVQERVVSLATIHRELYQTSGLTDIRADELLPRLVHHILKMGASPERPFDLDLKVDEIHLTPDQAVPLGLFLTEGLTNAIKHVWRGKGRKPEVGIVFSRAEDGMAQLKMTNTFLPADPQDASGLDQMELESDGFGSKLLAAFALQLDATLEKGKRDGIYFLSLRFQPSPMQQAEARAREESEEA